MGARVRGVKVEGRGDRGYPGVGVRVSHQRVADEGACEGGGEFWV